MSFPLAGAASALPVRTSVDFFSLDTSRDVPQFAAKDSANNAEEVAFHAHTSQDREKSEGPIHGRQHKLRYVDLSTRMNRAMLHSQLNYWRKNGADSDYAATVNQIVKNVLAGHKYSQSGGLAEIEATGERYMLMQAALKELDQRKTDLGNLVAQQAFADLEDLAIELYETNAPEIEAALLAGKVGSESGWDKDEAKRMRDSVAVAFRTKIAEAVCQALKSCKNFIEFKKQVDALSKAIVERVATQLPANYATSLIEYAKKLKVCRAMGTCAQSLSQVAGSAAASKFPSIRSAQITKSVGERGVVPRDRDEEIRFALLSSVVNAAYSNLLVKDPILASAKHHGATAATCAKLISSMRDCGADLFGQEENTQVIEVLESVRHELSQKMNSLAV